MLFTGNVVGGLVAGGIAWACWAGITKITNPSPA
jgi:hypothetical protein